MPYHDYSLPLPKPRAPDQTVKNVDGEISMEEVSCPDFTLISSQGTGDGVPPPPSPPSPPSPPPTAEVVETSLPSIPTASPTNVDGTLAVAGESESPSSSSAEEASLDSSSSTAVVAATAVEVPVAVKEVQLKKIRAAATVQQRLYRVRAGVGDVAAYKTPDIVSVAMDKMEEGQPFYGKAEVRFFIREVVEFSAVLDLWLGVG